MSNTGSNVVTEECNKLVHKYQICFIYAMLIVVTFAIFWQVQSFEFTNYDDDRYVSENYHILTGLKWDNIIWVFTSEHSESWHPLTGLSHMLDCQLFGLDAGRHHLVNLLFHTANALLLFTVFRKMTGALWQSAFVATLFAVHPLHVESVAWVSERKDVLSTFFWFLTMAAYFHYVKNPKTSRYILTLVLFALGLMAKPMPVTLPFVLLLLDYWPFERFERKNWHHLILEKIPFFILSTISSVITFLVQKNAGTVGGIELFPLTSRVANAIISYAKYIEKMICPIDLAAYYPYNDKFPVPMVFTVAVILITITFIVIRLGKKYKYLPIGWFWYLGTLVPVIGLVQVGDQAMADRYTYIPLTGLFIIITWVASDTLTKWKCRKIILSLFSLVIIPILSVCTWFQVGYWRDSESLYEHALQMTSENYRIYYNLGLALTKKQKFDKATVMFQRAIQLKPDSYQGYSNLGVVYTQLGRWTEAIEVFKQAIKLKPDYAKGHYNLGLAYLSVDDKDSALEEYKILKALDVEKAEALFYSIHK